MKTFRSKAPLRLCIGATVALAVGLSLSSCGSSKTSLPASTTESTTSVTSGAASVPGPSPAPQASSTIPSTLKGICAALAGALTVDELRPKNSGNWNSERQRIVVDAASNVATYSSLRKGAPAELASPLERLENYSRAVGDIVAGSASFDSAITAMNASRDLAEASKASETIELWKRKNC